MKIFIPFHPNEIGGTSIFFRKFRKSAEEMGHEITSNIDDDFDVMFVIVQCPLKYAILAKLRKKRIVQRLDGIYYKFTSNIPFPSILYPLFNLKIKIIHNYFADYIIYQSEFSKYSCEKFLGKRKGEDTIINNGVDLNNIPFNNIRKENKKVVRLLTFGRFRREDQLLPIIEATSILGEKFHLDIYGSLAENLSFLPSKIEKEKNISFLGKIENSKLLEKLDSYDIFLFSDQSACPNSVLESLAGGLPVVAFRRGSIEEIIDSGYNGEVVNLKPHDPFKSAYPFFSDDYINFSKSIRKISENIEEYRNNARKSAADKFNLLNMTEKYLEVLSG
jgi:glycosyltransferase involved in cell wall biosynthesis